LTSFQLSTVPTLIRHACSKQPSLSSCMDLLNKSIFSIVDDNYENVYEQLRQTFVADQSFEIFTNVSSSFDEIERELNEISQFLQQLNLPFEWTQSNLFDWTQV